MRADTIHKRTTQMQVMCRTPKGYLQVWYRLDVLDPGTDAVNQATVQEAGQARK